MKSIILLVGLLSIGSCAHSYKDLSAWNETKDTSLRLSLRSIKYKVSKVDLVAVVKNSYQFPVVIPEGALHFTAGDDDGVPSTPSPRKVLNPGDVAQLTVAYRFSAQVSGPYVLKLENIFTGKVIDVEGRSGSSTVGVGVFGGAGIGKAKAEGSSETFQKRGAIEDQPLPPATLQVPN